MRVLPARSPGVLLAAMADRAVAYDLVTETAHQLNASAGELLAACDGYTRFDLAVDEWATAGNIDRSQVAKDIDDALTTFETLGLVARDEDWVAPDAPTGAIDQHVEPTESTDPAGAMDLPLCSATHRVIGHDIAFRSDDQDLLDAIDAHLGTGREGLDPTLFFHVFRRPNSEQIVLRTERERTFSQLELMLDSLATIINEYAVWTHDCVTLHAGAVRSPDGKIVVLPAHSGHGKSTLSAALIKSGWDYLSDEAIGVRVDPDRPGDLLAVGYPKRLALDATSRAALGLSDGAPETRPEELRGDVARLDGDVGVITRVVLPRFEEAEGDTDYERDTASGQRGGSDAVGLPGPELLEPPDAIIEILANALNLSRVGEAGLEALCELAANVPTYRLVHSDASLAAQAIERLLELTPDDQFIGDRSANS